MGKQWQQWETVFLGSKITADGDCTHETKACSMEKNLCKLSILKSRHYFGDTGPYSPSYCFSNSRVWIWELDHKQSWVPKNWCLWTVVLEKILESPLDCKEIQPVNPKGNMSWIFIGRTDVETETPILGHLMQRDNSLEKTLMLGQIEGRRRRVWQRMRCWMTSLTQWTWVWASSGRWWWTGKPGVL